MTWVNLGCGPHPATAPWVNLDRIETDEIRPDLLVDQTDPLCSFADGSVEKLYLGHILEHVIWHHVPVFLAEIMRVLESGGHVMVVGPDLYKTLELYRQGREPWEIMEVVLEHADWTDLEHSGLTHQWNSEEGRIVKALQAAGFVDVTPTEAFEGWPVTNWSAWQCAVIARKP